MKSGFQTLVSINGPFGRGESKEQATKLFNDFLKKLANLAGMR